MFENVSVFHWVPHVEYEILVTRTVSNSQQQVTTSIFRRYKEITKWLSEVSLLFLCLSILKLNFLTEKKKGSKYSSSNTSIRGISNLKSSFT